MYNMTITLPNELVDRLDSVRGEVPRSHIAEALLNEYVSELEEKKHVIVEVPVSITTVARRMAADSVRSRF